LLTLKNHLSLIDKNNKPLYAIPMEYIKEKILFALDYIGGVFRLIWESIIAFPGVFKKPYLITQQIYFMGFESLFIVVFTSIFTGMVTAYTAWYQGKSFMPLVYIGMSVAKAEMIELGPVLTGLVVAGRVSSAIAAEIGTMKVTEQIDALEALAINPIQHLVVPRIISGVIILPILTIVSEVFAVLGGFLLARFGLGVAASVYFRGVRLNYLPITLYGGLLKSLTFGYIIALMGCYHGLNTKGGAEGVGESTTRAVVSTMVLLLMFDFIVSRLVFR